MTTISQEAIIRRVQGLLAKAESTDNAAEAEAFSAKAAELIDKYRLEAAQLRRPGDEQQYGRMTFQLAGHKYLRATLSLLMEVTEHYGVVVMIPSTGNSKYPTLVGDADDVRHSIMLFRSLVLQRDRALLSEPNVFGGNVNKFRNSFAYGYANRIGQRLEVLRRQQRQVAQVEHNAAALELYGRLNAVEKWLEAKRGKPLGKVKQNDAAVDPFALLVGDAAAQKADLGHGGLSGAGSRALGAGR